MRGVSCSSNFLMKLQYGYVDLLSAVLDEELCWVHIATEDICHPLCMVFAVDNNLAVVLRYRISFFFFK